MLRLVLSVVIFTVGFLGLLAFSSGSGSSPYQARSSAMGAVDVKALAVLKPKQQGLSDAAMGRGFMSRFQRGPATISASGGQPGLISRAYARIMGGPKRIRVAAPAPEKSSGAPMGRPRIRVVDDQGLVTILN
ncbi:MAG: hypothetical protein ACRBBK_09605 [Paracoccaceae bacterium]